MPDSVHGVSRGKFSFPQPPLHHLFALLPQRLIYGYFGSKSEIRGCKKDASLCVVAGVSEVLCSLVYVFDIAATTLIVIVVAVIVVVVGGDVVDTSTAVLAPVPVTSIAASSTLINSLRIICMFIVFLICSLVVVFVFIVFYQFHPFILLLPLPPLPPLPPPPLLHSSPFVFILAYHSSLL